MGEANSADLSRRGFWLLETAIVIILEGVIKSIKKNFINSFLMLLQ